MIKRGGRVFIPVQDFERTKRAILERIDMVTVVSEHVSLRRSGQRLVGLCPFHSEKTPSFTVSPELGLFKCFGCGKGGDIFSFVQLRENISFAEAARMLADRVGVEPGGLKRSSASGPSGFDLAKVNTWAVRFYRDQLQHPTLGRDARAYLLGRNFSDPTVERFSLGLALDGGPSLIQAAGRAGIQTPLLLAADLVRQSEQGRFYDTFRNRLMFPIRDVTRRVIGFGGRTLVDDRAKYLNTRQNALFDKGRQLYGLDEARDAIVSRGRAVVVEGYTDCLAAQQAGFTETVASLGTALTESHVDLLRRYCDEVILLFDSDEAGLAASERAIQVALPKCIRCRLARIPTGKDPSEFLAHAGPEAFSDVLNGAVDALEFKWSQTRERFEADSSDIRRREAVVDFLQIVAGAVDARAIDAIQRGLVVNQVAHLLRMDRWEVDRTMRQMRPTRSMNKAVGPTSSPATARAPNDQEQAAWTHLLEVVLSQPSVLSGDGAGKLPGVERIENECDRRIAVAAFELAQEEGAFQLADLLARLSEVEDLDRVSELAHRGAERGNFQKRFDLALERIVRSRDFADVERRRATRAASASPDEGVEERREELAAIHRGATQHRGAGFSPRRLIRQTRAGRNV